MKSEITITEALAEIKTLTKRIESTRDFVLKYGVRQGSTIDPLDDGGGSHVVVPQKLQSLKDLLMRKVAIRTAINEVNAATPLTVSGKTMSVAEWIIWRRDVFPAEIQAYRALQSKVLDARHQCQNANIRLIEDGKPPERVNEAGCFIPESEISNHIEKLVEIESTLDGQLSLVNAITRVTV